MDRGIAKVIHAALALAAVAGGCNLALDLPGFDFDAASAGAAGQPSGGGGSAGEGGTGGSQAKQDGAPCGLGSECESTHCADGFCCESACQGLCEACSDELTSGTANGVCGPITFATDPDSECTDEERCDGARDCRELDGTDCADGGECLSGNCVDTVCCASACADPCHACSSAKTDEAKGVCALVSAGTDPDGDCEADQRCDEAGLCRKVDGADCALGDECLTGLCVDDVCCETACTGECEACSTLFTGDSDGVCAPIAAGTNPDGDCIAGFGCTGAVGPCKKLDGTSCMMEMECVSGACVDGVCCESACGMLCQSCDGADTGGLDGDCLPVTPFTDPQAECTGQEVCSDLAMCALKPNGLSCSSPGQCASNQCVDNVCCVAAACPGTCMSCNGNTPGACSFVPAGTDPDSECPGVMSVCNGAGSCTT
jgi:hypothetical protein